MPIFQERKHRLPLVAYRGKVAVSFTACLQLSAGVAVDETVFEKIRDKILEACKKFICDPYAWCLMPDHLHLLIIGTNESSNAYQAMVWFKQQTGFWLSRNIPMIEWQTDFYDHVVRSTESLDVQGRYILENPVRAGLVKNWWEYRWSGGSLADRLRKHLMSEGIAL